MKKGIIGKKIGMTQIFDANGNVIPVTVIEAGPCTVTMKKTVATDGYDAVQLGFVDVEEKKLNKPEAGHFRKAGVSCKKHLKEFRLDDVSGFNTGDTVTADIFEAGRRYRNHKGSRILRCCKALERTHPQNDSRHRSGAPPARLDGCEFLALENLQEQAHGGTVRQRTGHCSQSQHR